MVYMQMLLYVPDVVVPGDLMACGCRCGTKPKRAKKRKKKK
jgi:hypothetical protein